MRPWEPKSSLSIHRLFVALALVVLLVVSMAHGLILFVAWKNLDDANIRLARGAAERTALRIANLIGQFDQSLAAQASDPRLAEIVVRAQPGPISQEEERMTREVPGAWLVRVLPENIDSPDEKRSPRMGYSDLNMVRNSGEKTAPPAIQLPNSPEAHLALVRRLAAGYGVIHASWPIKVLHGTLVDEGACGVELYQEDVGVAYRGLPDCKEGKPAGAVPVAGTSWKIAYWAGADASSAFGWFAAVLVGSLILIGGIAFWLMRWMNASLRGDLGNMTSLVRDMQSGNPFSDYHFKLAEFANMATEITRPKRGARAKSKQKPRSESRLKPFLRKAETAPESPETPDRELEFTPTARPHPPAAEPRPVVVGESAAGDALKSAIFRAYDIRGVVGQDLTPNAVYAIGRAIGSEMSARGHTDVAIAHDGRISSPELSESLARGLMESGRTVVDLGLAPTPVLYYATHELKATSGVMITGSHNPSQYNGLKIVMGGDSLTAPDIQILRRRIERNELVAGVGAREEYDAIPEYMDRVLGDAQLGRGLKVVVDCGNGAASAVAPDLLRSLGCEVIELFCEVDGTYPNHHPDPSQPENLEALIDRVVEAGADLGVAFDGDGDRLGVIDSSGRIIWPDRQMMLFAADVLSREPGADVIYDVKCSRHLPGQIVKNGGRPLMWKSGHALIKAKMKETGAMLAGEMTGHFFFQERWYGFDDAIYACARLVEILSNSPETSADIFARLPDSVNTPELVAALNEGESFEIMEKLRSLVDFPEARISELDGLRVDFMDGWGLVRASNTMPALTFRFEADSDDALARIQQQFKLLLAQAKPDLSLPF